MFRDLARKKQLLSDAECITLLKSTKRGILSVLGDDGYPYGVPHNHFYNEADGRLYFHSGMHGHKIDAIRACSKASYCVMDEGTPEENGWALNFRSVIVFGRIEIVEDHERAIELCRQLSYQFTHDEDYIAHEIRSAGPRTLVFALVPEHITGKRVNEK